MKQAKIRVLLRFVLFCQLTVVAQRKVDDFPETDSDSEAARLDTLFVELLKKPTSTGLILV